MDKLRLKGFTISSDSLQERFGVKMNDYEWNSFEKQITQTWENREFGLEGFVVKHLTNSLEQLGFKAQIIDGKLRFGQKYKS